MRAGSKTSSTLHVAAIHCIVYASYLALFTCAFTKITRAFDIDSKIQIRAKWDELNAWIQRRFDRRIRVLYAFS